MRVIAGKYKSRVLVEFAGEDVRPTSDRAKEALFNILSLKMYGARVLDLFAGSGALGIEALSRGSGHCVFVENSKLALDVARRNAELAKVEDRVLTVLSDAVSYVELSSEKFDIIFLDPPYNTGLLNGAIKKIAEKGLLSETGIIVAESAVGGEEPDCESFDIIRSAKYGKTAVFVLRARRT